MSAEMLLHDMMQPTLDRWRAIRVAVAVLVPLLLVSPPSSTRAQVRTSPRSVLSQRTGRPAYSLSLLSFSRDGQYILAQDDDSFSVLTVAPLKLLFRIPAGNAINSAQFTPDSRQVLFVSSSRRTRSHDLLVRETPRLERWSIRDRARIDSTEARCILRSCASARLSPDGRVYACVDSGGTLRFFELPSCELIFEKRKFGKMFLHWDPRDESYEQNSRYESGEPGSARIDFSPDGRFVIALPYNAAGEAVAWDLYERKALKLIGELKRLRRELGPLLEFAFLAPDRVIISKVFPFRETVNARVVAFPSGKLLSKPKVPPGPLSRATDPRLVLIYPFGQAAYHAINEKRSAAVEFDTGQVIISQTPALDVFGHYYVTEVREGEVGLYERGKGLQTRVRLIATSALQN